MVPLALTDDDVGCEHGAPVAEGNPVRPAISSRGLRRRLQEVIRRGLLGSRASTPSGLLPLRAVHAPQWSLRCSDRVVLRCVVSLQRDRLREPERMLFL